MTNRFERHPRLTWVVIFLLFLIFSVGTLEILARYGFELGQVVVYDAHPIFGYRPKPHQTIARRGHTVTLNEGALRTSSTWEQASPKQRILFLGDSVTYGGSYINNEDLFSTHAVTELPFAAGNAGVNGWGVLNIHAFITEMDFLPAETYVTVLPEGDFYRGLNRIGGQPLWTRQPKYALEELIYYGLYKLNLQMNGWLNPKALPEDDQYKTVDLAVRKLKEMDTFLKVKGFRHFIFITPSKQQALGKESIDPLIHNAIMRYDLSIHYLLDEIKKTKRIEEMFYDDIHLTTAGHHFWGKTIQILF